MFLSIQRATCFIIASADPGLNRRSMLMRDWFSLNANWTMPIKQDFDRLLWDKSMASMYLSNRKQLWRHLPKLSDKRFLRKSITFRPCLVGMDPCLFVWRSARDFEFAWFRFSLDWTIFESGWSRLCDGLMGPLFNFILRILESRPRLTWSASAPLPSSASMFNWAGFNFPPAFDLDCLRPAHHWALSLYSDWCLIMLSTWMPASSSRLLSLKLSLCTTLLFFRPVIKALMFGTWSKLQTLIDRLRRLLLEPRASPRIFHDSVESIWLIRKKQTKCCAVGRDFANPW